MSGYVIATHTGRPTGPEVGVVVPGIRRGRGHWADALVAAAERGARAVIGTRGRAYARAGQVQPLVIEPDSVQARVGGSGGAQYRVHLTPAGPGGTWKGTCTCPTGEPWCKHMVASAYVSAYLAAGRGATADSRPAPSPSPEVSSADPDPVATAGDPAAPVLLSDLLGPCPGTALADLLGSTDDLTALLAGPVPPVEELIGR